MKKIRKFFMVILIIIILLGMVVFAYTFHPKFGRIPTGDRLARIEQSPHYKDGAFQNLLPTPALTEGNNYFGVMYNTFIKRNPNRVPKIEMPSVKTNLHALEPNEDVIIWMGHSSYLIQINGVKFLIDPVLSGNASPVPGSITAFKGSDIFEVNEIPYVDYLLISHDHYDHLDYSTIQLLKGKVGKVITGLGVGEHFDHWDWDPKKIMERDWYERVVLQKDITIYIESARHFSGRGFVRNKSLWVSFLIETPNYKLFLGGDSGYGNHYLDIQSRHGAIDLAILDNGQYNEAWSNIHHMPHDVLKAAQDLKAKRIFPVHNSKFNLANHSWYEPLDSLSSLCEEASLPMLTPKIGEPIYFRDTAQLFLKWWKPLQ